VDDDLLLPWRRDLTRAPLADRIAARVAERIATGAIPGGTLLTEMELAAENDASRTPVREAMRHLEKRGLVRTLPKKGALVTIPTASERRDLLAVRSMLERDAVAAASADPERRAALVADLRTWVARQGEALDDPPRFALLDHGFHLQLIRHDGNAVVEEVCAAVAPRLVRLTYAAVAASVERLDRVRDEHTALADAVETGDQPLFARLISAHLAAAHTYPVAL